MSSSTPTASLASSAGLASPPSASSSSAASFCDEEAAEFEAETGCLQVLSLAYNVLPCIFAVFQWPRHALVFFAVFVLFLAIISSSSCRNPTGLATIAAAVAAVAAQFVSLYLQIFVLSSSPSSAEAAAGTQRAIPPPPPPSSSASASTTSFSPSLHHHHP
ncbi:hypothetical protein TYRP_003245 [Tyrophagus putrescentiae]|nr:hypothetical protein TYRP_003245 [Tyrophagus putrescentiae]